MLRQTSLVFSTLVLLAGLALFSAVLCYSKIANAEPNRSAPPTPHDADDSTRQIPPQVKENMSIAPAPDVAPEAAAESRLDREFQHDTYYYPYSKEWIAFAGLIFGVKDSSGSPNKMNLAAGSAYVFPSLAGLGKNSYDHKWELGAELSFAGRGHFWLSNRHVYNVKGAFRPYYSYGLMHNLVPDDGLASFANWDNYLARFAIGMQDIRVPPRSLHLELVAAAGAKDFLLIFTYGAAWGL